MTVIARFKAIARTLGFALVMAAGYQQTICAEPVILDTPDALIVVVRPIDSWAADDAYDQVSLDLLQQKRVGYSYFTPEGKYYNGSPGLFMDRKDLSEPLAREVDDQLAAKQVDYTKALDKFLNFQRAMTIPSDKIADFLRLQQKLYEKSIVMAGDPAQAREHMQVRKTIGGILAVGLIALGMNHFGAVPGANIMLSNPLPPGMSQLVKDFGRAMVPVPLPPMDLSTYKTIDIRAITTQAHDRVGQVIIAYKVEKTPEVERSSFATAIVNSFGLDTPIDQIVKNREADYAHRVAIWDQCVAAGQCKK